MTKETLLIPLSLVVLCAMASPSLAIQRKHRPWFSHPSAPAETLAEPIKSQPLIVRNDGGKRVSGSEGKGQQVVRQALQYKGTRYKFGGTSKRGVDCSGLVTRVWEDLKMNKIPRASSALYNSGTSVHLAELRPGDLVFFKNTYRRGISHVGVYAGDNKFVHAAGHSQGVTITKLSDPYYQLHYAGARRLY